MIDVLGMLGTGYYNGDVNSNGIFIYNDASIVIGYKLPGSKFYTMTTEEKIATYTTLRDMINQLQILEKGEGCIYQFMSQPNYDLSKKRKEAIDLNYLENDDTYKNKPFLLKKILDKNTNELYDIYENYEVNEIDGYIFVRYYFNLGKRKIDYASFMKDIFNLNIKKDKEINDLNNTVDTTIAAHNSKFKRLGAEPLTLLEMTNVIRKYFGYSVLKNIPSSITNSSYLKSLFPGEIEVTDSYIKTQEKIVLDTNKKKLDIKRRKKLDINLDKLLKKDNFIINEMGTQENKNIELDLDYIYKDMFKVDPIHANTISLYDKYINVRNDILNILKIIEEKDYLNFKYFTEEKFKLYKYLITYVDNKKVENNDTYLKIFSMNEVPSTLDMFHGDKLNSMSGDFTITMNFRILPDNQTMLKMRRQIVIENLKLDMPVMKWFLPIESIQEKVQMLSTVMRELESSDYSRTEANIYLTLRGTSENDLREKEIGQYNGITNVEFVSEKDNAGFHILSNAMPTGLTASGLKYSKRVFLLNTTNLAQFSPLIGEEKGSKRGIMTVMGYKGLININLMEAPAGHLSIAGSTGGGKSVLANKLMLDYKKAGDVIISTEKGNSFTRTTLFFGGKVYKPDMTGIIKINPFVMPEGAIDDIKFKKDIYAQMIGAMAQMCNNYNESMKNLYYKILKFAFENKNGGFNTKYVRSNSVTPTKLLNLMKAHPLFEDSTDEINSFEKYTKNGIYGEIFDGNQGLDLNYPMINIDYSGLQEASIKDFVFKSLLQNIFNEMSKRQGKKNFFNVNDEFWDAISSSVSTGESVANTAIGQIESFFRVARKLGGKIAVVSQGISDINDSPLKSAILNNIYHSFFTNTSNAGELKVIEELFKFEENQLQEIKTLSMVKGVYSEYFVSAPYGEKISGSNTQRFFRTKFKYFPTSLELALFTTHPKEVDIYNMLYEKLGYKGDPSYAPQSVVMKAVRIFLEIIPHGSDADNDFQEKLLQNQEDYRETFIQIVEERFGNLKNASNVLTWDRYLNE